MEVEEKIGQCDYVDNARRGYESYLACMARIKAYNEQANTPGERSYNWQVWRVDKAVGDIKDVHNSFRTKDEAIEACEWLNISDGYGLEYVVKEKEV